MTDRSESLKQIRESISRTAHLTDGVNTCIKNNVIANSFKILERIGSGSANGEAFKICHPIKCTLFSCTCAENPIYLAIKKIPLSKKNLRYKDTPNSEKALRTELWAEILIMKLCYGLVQSKITPNLPLYVNYFVCNSCTYENENLKSTKNNKPCVILINELASAGDIKQWSKTKRPDDEWLNAYFQIYSALYALQKYFDLSHHDLHWGNVLVHKISAGGIWRYTIDGKIYDVPNLGWLFTLWDFGLARIPGKIEIKTREELYKRDTQNPRLLVDYRRISNVPAWRADINNIKEGEARIPISSQIKDFVNVVSLMFKNGAPIQSIITSWHKMYQNDRKNDAMVIDNYSFDKFPSALDPNLLTFMRDQTRMAYQGPPNPLQVLAQEQLWRELKYDSNIVDKMTQFMEEHAQRKRRIGHVMIKDGKLMQAVVDNPTDTDWVPLEISTLEPMEEDEDEDDEDDEEPNIYDSSEDSNSDLESDSDSL